MSSDGRLRSYVERVENLDEEIKGLNDDKRDVFAEAKAEGYDVKILKAVIAKRRKDANEVAEFDAVFAVYWDEIHGTGTENARVQAHEREAA